MRIKFEKDGDSLFAVSTDVEIGNKYYEEVMWAEIAPRDGGFTVTWEDDWKTKHYFSTVDEAKKHVVSDHNKHSFHNNGRTADI